MMGMKWISCPICGSKTRDRIKGSFGINPVEFLSVLMV